MSSKDFLKKMIEAGEAKSASTDFVTVAKMIIRPGYSGFLSGHNPMEFFRAYDQPDENVIDACIASVAELLRLAGSKRDPVFAFLFSIPLDTNMSEKVDWEIEQVSMIDNRKDTDDHINEYRIFTNALIDGDFPLNKWFWGSYKNVETGKYVNQAGEDKKRFIAVPVEKFVNELEARASAGTESGTSISQWSDTLRANHVEPDKFESFNGEGIRQSYEQMLKTKEKPYSGAPDLPDGELTPPKIKQYLAQSDMYNCTPDDIDIVLNSVPF